MYHTDQDCDCECGRRHGALFGDILTWLFFVWLLTPDPQAQARRRHRDQQRRQLVIERNMASAQARLIQEQQRQVDQFLRWRPGVASELDSRLLVYCRAYASQHGTFPDREMQKRIAQFLC